MRTNDEWRMSNKILRKIEDTNLLGAPRLEHKLTWAFVFPHPIRVCSNQFLFILNNIFLPYNILKMEDILTINGWIQWVPLNCCGHWSKISIWGSISISEKSFHRNQGTMIANLQGTETCLKMPLMVHSRLFECFTSFSAMIC